jgi:hypothetical protein
MKVAALQCHIDGKRKRTHKLTKQQAAAFRIAALHLARFLKKEYGL